MGFLDWILLAFRRGWCISTGEMAMNVSSVFQWGLTASGALALEGTTPLMECAWNGSVADVNARDHVGRTVLDYARTAGVVAYLRAQGAHSGKN